MSENKTPNNRLNTLGLRVDHIKMHKDQLMTPLQARYTLGLTQSAMARTLGISTRQWQHYEHGTQTVPKPITLALRYLIAVKFPKARARVNRIIQQQAMKTRKYLKKLNTTQLERRAKKLL